jgi:CTP:molybdopterin cytidylyltransferase MocA
VTTAIVPAAGLGSRLGRTEPKALVEIGGRCLLGYVLDALGPYVERTVVIVRPGTEPHFHRALDGLGWSGKLELRVQEDATGSADAVAIGLDVVPDDEPCIVAWGDQVGVSRRTVGLIAAQLENGHPGLVLPLVEVERPYVWFDLDRGELRVHRSRDGDPSPARGTSDVGIFGLVTQAGRDCIAHELANFRGGKERDFVYVLPGLARRHGLAVIEVDDPNEALGVNDPSDLAEARRVLELHR